jgi:hypothetical protein
MATGELANLFRCQRLLRIVEINISCEQLLLDLFITPLYSAPIIEAYAAPDVLNTTECTRCVFFYTLPARSISGEHYGQRQSKMVRQ